MNAIVARDVGKRYGRHWALRECSLSIPLGRVVGLVGANGAGKTTLLHLAVGLIAPTEGSLTVLGEPPAADAAKLARVGFLAQDAPVYPWLSVADHLEVGERLNPQWDRVFARQRLERLGLRMSQRAGRLSGGQRAQLALTLAIGKRPELLVLDEPVASLDPLARREFLQDLMALVAEDGPSVVLSSHLLSDVERVCDYLVVLTAGRVCVEGDVEQLLTEHKLLTGRSDEVGSLPRSQTAIRTSDTGRQTTVLVRTREPVHDPRWSVSDVGLEELVLAYMSAPVDDTSRHDLTVVAS